MVNEEFIVNLPDGTRLIAECERNGDNPSVSVTHINAQKQKQKVALVEYKHDEPIGRKLYVSAYRNFIERPASEGSFCYCIKPTFEELRELYEKNPDEQYRYVRYEDREEIHSTSVFEIVYRDFLTEASVDHTGHNIKLTEFIRNGEVRSYSFECFDCFGIPYSADKPDYTEIDTDEVEFEVKDITKDKSYTNPRITYLDEIEYECWDLFKAYASYVGVEFGEGIDYSIAKELSAKFMSVVERVFGIPFPMSKEG